MISNCWGFPRLPRNVFFTPLLHTNALVLSPPTSFVFIIYFALASYMARTKNLTNDSRSATSSAEVSPNLPGVAASTSALHIDSLEVVWVENNGVRFPFLAGVVGDGTGDGDETFDPIQYATEGVVTSSFLNAGAISHTVKFRIPEEDVARVNSRVQRSER